MKLETPVTYQGGKQRVAYKIIDIIEERNRDLDGKVFYDLCCGSGSITLETINRNIPFSKNKMLDWSVWGDFWKSIGDGNFSIELFKCYVDNIPEKEYIQKHLEKMGKESPYDGVLLSHVYRYLLLQAGSFGGKQIWMENNQWKNTSFRSYWLPTESSNRRSPVNPMMPMPETLYKRVESLWYNLHDVIVGKNASIEGHTTFPEHSIIYVDPPYKKTTRYGKQFDVVSWVKEVKKNCNVKIYVSEQEALSDKSFLISEKRSKGNISGNNTKGVQEWLSEF